MNSLTLKVLIEQAIEEYIDNEMADLVFLIIDRDICFRNSLKEDCLIEYRKETDSYHYKDMTVFACENLGNRIICGR